MVVEPDSAGVDGCDGWRLVSRSRVSLLRCAEAPELGAGLMDGSACDGVAWWR